MYLSECLGKENGALTIGGIPATKLAEQYGTPLYVMDEATIRKNCRLFRESMEEYYKESQVLYASKALNCVEVCKIIAEEGLGIDCVSGGEIYTTLKAGFDPGKIYFHGNNKTRDEMEYAIKSGVGRFVVDNVFELRELDELAGAAGANAPVGILLRIKPGVEAHTHEFIKTGQIDSKFGFALENGEALQAVKAATATKNLKLVGLHCHIGSQIFDDKPFMAAAEIMLRFYKQIKDDCGITLSELNLGGGFGIKYTEADRHISYPLYMKEVAEVIHDFCEKNALLVPKVLIEPGRAIVGEAGITLYTVGAVKEIADVRNYVCVDGGMTDNLRHALYGAKYSAVVANRVDKPADYKATIAGKCCESGDLIQKDVMLAKPQKGDILAVTATGAYNYSMSSNYNRIPKPAMVMVKDEKARTIIKRETYEDIVRNDV